MLIVRERWLYFRMILQIISSIMGGNSVFIQTDFATIWFIKSVNSTPSLRVNWSSLILITKFPLSIRSLSFVGDQIAKSLVIMEPLLWSSFIYLGIIGFKLNTFLKVKETSLPKGIMVEHFQHKTFNNLNFFPVPS